MPISVLIFFLAAMFKRTTPPPYNFGRQAKLENALHKICIFIMSIMGESCILIYKVAHFEELARDTTSKSTIITAMISHWPGTSVI